MIEQAPDTTWLRQTSAQRGAVARVGAVSRTERSSPVDPARVTDPRWSDWPRPDPARIAIADITQFQSLVYGPSADPSGGRQRGGALAAAAQRTLAADPYPQPDPQAPPADRIAATLQHLRGLRGL